MSQDLQVLRHADRQLLLLDLGWSANLKCHYPTLDPPPPRCPRTAKIGRRKTYKSSFRAGAILRPHRSLRRKLTDTWPCRKEPAAAPWWWPPPAASGRRGPWWRPIRRVWTARGRRDGRRRALASPSSRGEPCGRELAPLNQIWRYILWKVRVAKTEESPTWLWPTAWCAYPARCPSCHASPSRQEGSPSQAPAPRTGRGCGRARTRSSLRCSECRRCTHRGRIYACPIGSGSWAPDLSQTTRHLRECIQSLPGL